jgi:hypothetical protein
MKYGKALVSVRKTEKKIVGIFLHFTPLNMIIAKNKFRLARAVAGVRRNLCYTLL